MLPVMERSLGTALRKMAFLLFVTMPILVHAQGLTTPAPADTSPLDPATPSPGFSPPRPFTPYSGEKRPEHFSATQTPTSGFNWTQFFRSAAQTGARFAAPKLFTNDARSQLGADPLFSPRSTGITGLTPGMSAGMSTGMKAMGGGASTEMLGNSFNMSSRGVNFSSNSSALDLHLSIQSMFQPGWSSGGGSSFSHSEMAIPGNDLFGGTPGAGGLNGIGGRDGAGGRAPGARISLQLKF